MSHSRLTASTTPITADPTIRARNRSATDTHQLPSIFVALANILMLTAIIAVGAAYLGPLQVYGGLFGIACFGVGPAMAATGRWFAPRLAAS